MKIMLCLSLKSESKCYNFFKEALYRESFL